MRRRWILIVPALLLTIVAAAQQLPNAGVWIWSTEQSTLQRDCAISVGSDQRLRCVKTPTPAPTATPGGGGGTGGGHLIATPGGEEREPKWWSEVVTTVIGQSYVDTVHTIPAGSIVERCQATTLTNITGGYSLGTIGDEDRYAVLAGTAGENSAHDLRFMGDHPSYGATVRRLKCRHSSGKYVNIGTARVTCFYRAYPIPTPTP